MKRTRGLGGNGDGEGSGEDEDEDWAAELADPVNLSSLFSDIRGRKHQAYDGATYFMPIDENELDRLDTQHQVYTMAMGGNLTRTALPDNFDGRVLDVGTGTGRWAIEFGDRYPFSNVIGLDISPVQPKSVPLNVTFEIENAQELSFPNNYFDLVYSRALIAGISDWKVYIAQLVRVAKPGGMVECIESIIKVESLDKPFSQDSALRKFDKMFQDISESVHVDLESPYKLKPMMQEAGLRDVHQEEIQIPVGTWPEGAQRKKLGRLAMQDLIEVCTSWVKTSLNLASASNSIEWTDTEIEIFLMQIRSEIMDPDMRLCFKA